MDILSDTAVWVLVKGYHLTLATARWAGGSLLRLLDWGSEKTVAGLRLLARWAQWTINNPRTALLYMAIAGAVIFLILAIEIYVYDLLKRRKAAPS